MSLGDREPLFAIGVVARLLDMHDHTIRNYEVWGLVVPARSPKGTRYYSQADIARIRQVREWIEMLGLNKAGVEVMIRLLQRINELEKEIAQLQAPLRRNRKY